VHANLDALVSALYVRVDDLLPKRVGPGRPPRITDAELIALAVAQMFMGIPNDRQFLAFARWRLGHLFRYLPQQPGYNKRLRGLAATIAKVITHLAVSSPSFCDGLRLLDSTPVPCGQSRETARRSELAGYAAYGWCKSHSRYFWGFRLYLLCASDGMPIAFELAPANTPERVVAAEMLERVDLDGYTVIADKGFAGAEFEQHMALAHQQAPPRRPSQSGRRRGACDSGSRRCCPRPWRLCWGLRLTSFTMPDRSPGRRFSLAPVARCSLVRSALSCRSRSWCACIIAAGTGACLGRFLP